MRRYVARDSQQFRNFASNELSKDWQIITHKVNTIGLSLRVRQAISKSGESRAGMDNGWSGHDSVKSSSWAEAASQRPSRKRAAIDQEI